MAQLSLRNRLLLPTLGVIAAGMLLTSIVCSRSAGTAIEQAMLSQVEATSATLVKQIGSWVRDLKTDLASQAGNAIYAGMISSGNSPQLVEQANRTLARLAEDYEHYEFLAVAGSDGNLLASSDRSLIGSINVADRGYFQQSMTGKEALSDILKSKASGKPIFVVSRPLKVGGAVEAVFFAAVDFNHFAGEFIAPVRVGEQGYAFATGKSGLVAAHPKANLILQTNLRDFDFGATFFQKQNGLITYTFQGVEKLVAFRTDPSTGWLIGVGADTEDIFAPAARVRSKSLIMMALVLTIVSIAVIFTINPVVRALRKGVELASAIRKGDLNQRLNLVRGDEIGTLANALDEMAEGLQGRASLATTIAEGDLTSKVELLSEKDQLGRALQQMVKRLAEMLGLIQMAGEQIASGSGQVSEAAQSLSEGATESASSLEEITSSMHELESRTRTNAESATQANALGEEAKVAASRGSSQMSDMTSAMDEINQAGQDISKIIKTIDEIAFQTNLLALNAAVEAARAGQHGKGFAVVAEEVRNLAARSAQAASETADLIQGTVEKTDRGAEIASRTETALGEIVTQVTRATDLVADIAMASSEQAEGITQITQGLSQIDSVTQMNTASAEESAAAAEQLSSQAQELRQLLSRFRLAHSRSAASDVVMAVEPTMLPAAGQHALSAVA